jgi:hypothetical protein
VVPLAAWLIARKRAPSHTWAIVGAAFGFIISPFSLGLYATYFAGILYTGLLGLASTLFHGAPGYHVALWLGVVPSGEVVSGVGHLYVELLNGVIWAIAYGFLGATVDWLRARGSARKLAGDAP